MKRERKRESGSEGRRLRGSVGPPRRERWLPSLKHSPASCPAPQLLPTLPQAAAGGSAVPAPAKAGKGGKGKGARCTAGLPGPSATRAGRAATRPGAGRRRRPWVRALVRSGVSRAQKRGVRALTELRDASPSRSAFSFPRRWGGCLAASAGRPARTGNQVRAPQACKAEKSRLRRGKMEKWECREPEQRDGERRRGGGRRW